MGDVNFIATLSDHNNQLLSVHLKIQGDNHLTLFTENTLR